MGKEQTREGLNAVTLKNALWETLGDIRSGDCEPAVADSIASQAREILRTMVVAMGVRPTWSLPTLESALCDDCERERGR